MAQDSLGRPIPDNHPLRRLGDYVETQEKRVATDTISKPKLVKVKKAIDAVNARREMMRIDAMLAGWGDL